MTLALIGAGSLVLGWMMGRRRGYEKAIRDLARLAVQSETTELQQFIEAQRERAGIQ